MSPSIAQSDSKGRYNSGEQGSTDGTKEYLDSQDDVKAIHQENLGGAGGFYAGTRYAYESGYEWIWMMDDDGLPADNQLEELLKAAEKHHKKVLNALVVSKDDHTLFAFRDQKPLASLDLTREITEEIFCPFNGTFIHRSVIEKIGFIKKEMFIWGDEGEYMCRIKKNGYHLYTATKAIHYHPNEKGNKNYAFPIINKGRILLKPEKMSHYYYRNLGYNAWHYGTMLSVIKQCILHTAFFFRTGRFTEMKKFYKYYYKGITNDYSI